MPDQQSTAPKTQQPAPVFFGTLLQEIEMFKRQDKNDHDKGSVV